MVASFQRIFKVSSPTAGGFYQVIVGADKCLAEPETCTLEGGVVGDEANSTVTINLTRPDAEFFQKLALPHAAILPADAPPRMRARSPSRAPAPYMISAYDPNKELAMERNPHFKVWSEDAQPDGYPDEVQFDFGLTDEAEVTAVQNGEADWMFDPPPPDRLGEIGSKYKDQVYINTLTAWWYAPMNTRIPPFDNLKARQAVNFAIDRKALVNLFGGPVLASPVCQVLPPGFPGHVDYCPYTKDPGTTWSAPDLEKARQLVEESGTKGQKVTIVPQDNAVDEIDRRLPAKRAERHRLCRRGQADLVEHTVHLHPEQQQQGADLGVAMVPGLPGGFRLPLCAVRMRELPRRLGLLGQHFGFCDKEINDRMLKALDLGVTDPDAANKEWAEIDKAVTDMAPAAAMFTPKHVDFVSKRLGNFQFNAQYYWMVTQSWVQ